MMSSRRLLKRRANFRRNSTFLTKSVKDEYHPTETGSAVKIKHKIKPSQHITDIEINPAAWKSALVAKTKQY